METVMGIIDELTTDMWAYSATMLLIMSAAAFVLGLVLTHQAGFYCRVALVRYFQRLAFMALAFALLLNAIDVIQAHRAPSFHGFVTELAFMFVLFISALRHKMAPEIPAGASWGNPVTKVKLFTRRDTF